VPIELDERDLIAKSILRTGVYDLVVTEALFRLTDSGDLCLDVGANIGYMSSVLAVRAGETGAVHVFEPNPQLLPALRRNLAGWRSPQLAPLTLHAFAASDRAGEATFALPDAENLGQGAIGEGATTVTVPTRPLADVVDRADVMKIDVEGHELAAFRGAGDLVGARGLRDIVFEEAEALPTPVTAFLQDRGYTIFGLEQGPFGPRLVRDVGTSVRLRWDPANYLATRDPERAAQRFARSRWTALRPRPLA
jgi:FkbM family methyltransferase